jgi:hypothetical protein
MYFKTENMEYKKRRLINLRRRFFKNKIYLLYKIWLHYKIFIY